MKILVPDYLLQSVIRHYETLSKAYHYDGNNRAANAKRVSGKEIQRLRNLINANNAANNSVYHK